MARMEPKLLSIRGPSRHLSAVPKPTALPAGVADAFARHGTPRRLRRGGRLFEAGDPVKGLHLVESGHLRIVVGGNRPMVLHHEGPGGILGETALFGGTPYPGTAIATEATVCRHLSHGRILALLRDDPDAAAFFLHRLAVRLRGVITRFNALHQTSVAVRLARHLMERPGAGQGRRVSLGMTQEELAAELGTVREVVVRELRRLGERGLVASGGRGLYRVVDAAALRAIAETGE
jgi:CRP/FNR family cyclic AMP-dependent transcriptional regulator